MKYLKLDQINRDWYNPDAEESSHHEGVSLCFRIVDMFMQTAVSKQLRVYNTSTTQYGWWMEREMETRMEAMMQLNVQAEGKQMQITMHQDPLIPICQNH